MDRYIVNNNVSGQQSEQIISQTNTEVKSMATVTSASGPNSVMTNETQLMATVTSASGPNSVMTNETQPTYIIHPGPSKMIEAASFKLEPEHHGDIVDEIETDPQFSTKQIDETQFGENVSNTTYIIDNNSSNSIDSVRIGNHSFVPVVDSSLYNISVAGSSTQYTIEGVVNPGLGNYIIEAPAYIVETQSVGTTHTMYIQQPEETSQEIHQEIKEPDKKEKSKKVSEKKKKKEVEEGPFYCNMCSAVFHSSASLRFHSYHHNPKNKRFSCIGCGKAFGKDKEKEEHEWSCHLNYTNNKFNCIFCDLPFNSPKGLRMHENKHRPLKKTKRYRHMCVCIKCKKAFNAINTLKTHIKKIHGGNAGPDKKKKVIKQENFSLDVNEIKFEVFE